MLCAYLLLPHFVLYLVLHTTTAAVIFVTYKLPDTTIHLHVLLPSQLQLDQAHSTMLGIPQ